MALFIITDSASDLLPEIKSNPNIEVIPMIVTLNDKDYYDGENITAKQVTDAMKEGVVPKTALVPSSMVEDSFKKHAENGDEVIFVSFSSALSGSYNLVKMLGEEIRDKYPNFKLEVIDSKCASFGTCMVIIDALNNIQSGMEFDEIVKNIKLKCENMEHIFTVDNLEYLYRGGRVSRSAKVVGGLLGIKPILHVDDNGGLAPIDKVRGINKAFAKMVDIIGERCKNLKGQVIGLAHSDCAEYIDIVKEMIEQKYGCKEFVIGEIGSSISAHSGPGTFAIFFISD